MTYEIYNQLPGRAGARQIASPSMGPAHNPGCIPYLGISAVSRDHDPTLDARSTLVTPAPCVMCGGHAFLPFDRQVPRGGEL